MVGRKFLASGDDNKDAGVAFSLRRTKGHTHAEIIFAAEGVILATFGMSLANQSTGRTDGQGGSGRL